MTGGRSGAAAAQEEQPFALEVRITPGLSQQRVSHCIDHARYHHPHFPSLQAVIRLYAPCIRVYYVDLLLNAIAQLPGSRVVATDESYGCGSLFVREPWCGSARTNRYSDGCG